MIDKIILVLAGFVIATISRLGYGGIVLLMAIESACIPLPSEIILPFSGYLVFRGEMHLQLVALAGAFGCVVGSIVAYFVGAWGGRALIEKYGKYILISHHDLALADRWFQRHGDITVFVARLLPIIRTFIAFPAGVARMRLWRFNVYTFVGSYLWSLTLAWIGMKLGEHWDTLGVYYHRFDIAVVAVLLAAVVWYVWRHVRHYR